MRQINEIQNSTHSSFIDLLDENAPRTTSQVYMYLFKNKTFFYLALSLSIFFFISTNIQFWMSDYLVTINEVKYNEVVIVFAAVCITGPIFGAILSGFIGKKLGGYQSMNALPFVIVLSIGVSVFSLPVCFIPKEYTWVVYILLWIIFFLGGIGVPIMTGVMLAVVEPEYRPQASSLAQTMYQGIGYFPAPFIYGLIQENTGGKQSKYGMKVTMSLSVLTWLITILALYHKPDLKNYWIEKRNRMIAKYME